MKTEQQRQQAVGNGSKRSRKASETDKRMAKKQPLRRGETALKVVYISTPMKVTTSASKFRAIVQELTGQESDVSNIMDNCGGNDTWMVPDDYHQDHDGCKVSDAMTTINNNNNNNNTKNYERSVPLVVDDGSSPSVSSSEEFVEQFDGVFVRGQDSHFDLFDHTSLLFDQYFHHLDVLGGSY
ncbi:hypothetical protein SOVF_139670 [Spinacia oleracea]|nr:hypothetical protein SOVF_139670 [Spinacia oleracea]